MVSLTFYGGLNEIGGNRILLEDGDVRVFFDFGQSFTMGCDYFGGWLNPRRVNGLGDYFEFGLLPKLEGLYAKDLLQFTNIPYVEPRFDAVFLSHAHFDHVSHIEFLDPEIPIYLGVGTKLFMEAMEKTSSFCNYRDHRYHGFRTGDRIKVGSLVVEPIHVDHSIPAAYGFIIHTSAGSVVYTGDLRAHGPRKDMTKGFTEIAHKCEPIAMICEGTRMTETEHRKNHSEKQVKELSDSVVSSTDKAVFVTRYSRDMDRFRSFYNVAKNNDRKIVVSPKTAYLLNKLVDDKRLDLPDPLKDEDILIYYRRKKTGEFHEKDYYVWERLFIEKMVNHEFIHNNQKDLLMDIDFNQFTELIDIRPDPDCQFIHSMSEPFSEEDIEDRIIHNWLEHFQMRFHQLHASGHMNRQQIVDLVKYVKPERIFPVHTENPHLFQETGSSLHKVKCGEEYRLK
jgi:ribonuclease J